MISGARAAFISTSLFSAANLARKVLFLDVIQRRSDWHGLLVRFHASGTSDLQSFVVIEHLQGLIGALLVSTLLGAVCGAIGGTIAAARRVEVTTTVD